MCAAEHFRVRVLAWLVLATLVVLLLPRTAAARPVIPPEREQEVQALFRPHRLGDEVAPGWRLQTIAIETATIRVGVVGPHEHAELTLDHPDYAPPHARRSGSFALSVTVEPSGSEPAIRAIMAALGRNDDGAFWPTHGTDAVEGEPNARFASGPRAWITDGLLMFAVLVATTTILLRRALSQAPRWIGWALLAVFAVGAALRVGLSPVATLEPWSYTRVPIVARWIYEGPALAWIHPGRVHLTEVITTTVLACAIAAPLVVFVMARHLLASDRAALVSAGIVAVLPLHLRFSHSDAASIPSLTISAAMFAMVLAAAREQHPRWPIAMIALLPIPMIASFLLRPPNVLYGGLMLALIVVHGGVSTDRPPVSRRRLLAIGMVVVAVTLGFGVPHVLGNFGTEVREGLGVATLTAAVRVIFSLEYDTLINPQFTPPGVTALAVWGSVDLIRRRRWRLAACLGGWLLASLVTHAYVVPRSPFMQARYHLHLVVPFVCLAACGVEALLARLRGVGHARTLVFAAFGYIVASPLIHLRFVRDVAFDDQREWAFVHGLRNTIPPGCAIVEHASRGAGARFGRVGAFVTDGMPRNPWTIVAIDEAAGVRDVLAALPACAYWYEGMPCWGDRADGVALAPTCEAIHAQAVLEEVDRVEFASRPYDENLAVGLEAGDPLALRLFRLRDGARPPP